MINIQEAAKDTYWIGGNDRRIKRFENLFPLPSGVSYNSYLVKDEKIALFDTVDLSVADQFFENLEAALDGQKPDYLVVLHMEPDHSSQMQKVIEEYPDITVVTCAQAAKIMTQFFPALANAKVQLIKEGDTLCTGKHTFHFISAPMVHWPEVMLAYDDCSKALFSADAFGTFGALEGSIFADDYDFEKRYLDDARRYYANIVGKYGPLVQTAMKKADEMDIQEILPLHGPVWRKNLSWYLDKYRIWAKDEPETEDTMIVYGSLHGHTAEAANTFACRLRCRIGSETVVYDVSDTDVSFLIGEVWRCRKIVLFCPTYNTGIYPKMDDFISDIIALNVKNRIFAFAENGCWAPTTAKLMRERLSVLKDNTLLTETLTFKSALHESDSDRLDAFVSAVAEA